MRFDAVGDTCAHLQYFVVCIARDPSHWFLGRIPIRRVGPFYGDRGVWQFAGRSYLGFECLPAAQRPATLLPGKRVLGGSTDRCPRRNGSPLGARNERRRRRPSRPIRNWALRRTSTQPDYGSPLDRKPFRFASRRWILRQRFGRGTRQVSRIDVTQISQITAPSAVQIFSPVSKYNRPNSDDGPSG